MLLLVFIMHQAMWITKVLLVDRPRGFWHWTFLMSKSTPSFAPFVSESSLFLTPGGGNLFYFKCQNCPLVWTPCCNPLGGMSESCQNPLWCPCGGGEPWGFTNWCITLQYVHNSSPIILTQHHYLSYLTMLKSILCTPTVFTMFRMPRSVYLYFIGHVLKLIGLFKLHPSLSNFSTRSATHAIYLSISSWGRSLNYLAGIWLLMCTHRLQFLLSPANVVTLSLISTHPFLMTLPSTRINNHVEFQSQNWVWELHYLSWVWSCILWVAYGSWVWELYSPSWVWKLKSELTIWL